MNTDKTIKKNSVKTNMLLQTIYQLVILVFPMIVSPYLTRVLGEGPLGEYTYSSSIAYYFIVLAALGISQYGQRIISQRREDQTLLRKTFWSLYFVHICLAVISILAFVLFSFFFDVSYKLLFYIEIIYVSSSLFDITWLFYGLENFKSVVWKNAVIKILESVCIFCFVRSASDLWIYTLIMSSSTLLGQAVLLPKAIRSVRPIAFGWSDIKEHVKPLFVLSIAAIASTLYTVFDKTLLGAMTNTDNVAYYEYSNKIVNIPKSLMGVITIVFFLERAQVLKKKILIEQKETLHIHLITSDF
jgi:O-antigen/teichoic acid export membrane protein